MVNDLPKNVFYGMILDDEQEAFVEAIKDLRGEEGYKAWTEHNKMIREERKKYDKLHSGKFKY